jgi:sigma-B regulation protein RsbU (phosphoserine phosphatase)
MSRLAGRMTAGESGSAVITLGGRNWYVVFASIPSPGWSLGIAFPSEDTLLPASFIESGVKGTAKEATSWMEETATRVEAATILAVVIFGGIFGAVGYLLGREIDRRAGVVTALAKRIGGGDLERKIDSSPNVMGGPLKETVEAMEAMRGGLKLHIAGLQSEAANKGRREMEQEISAAIGRDTQEGRIPLIDGYQMAAKSGRSGKGDFPFYDLIELDGGRLAIVIGEVSGSGVPAAVLGVMVRTLFRALSPVFDPAEVLRQANLRLSEATHGMTVSCALFILDIEGHTAEYANAGHSPPFVIGEPGSVDTLCSGGIPLGGLDNLEPEVVLRPIGKGDLLVLYSDGLVEEASKFNLEQLITLLIENRAAQPSEIVDVVDKKSRFGGRTPTDYALIIIKRV